MTAADRKRLSDLQREIRRRTRWAEKILDRAHWRGQPRKLTRWEDAEFDRHLRHAREAADEARPLRDELYRSVAPTRDHRHVLDRRQAPIVFEELMRQHHDGPQSDPVRTAFHEAAHGLAFGLAGIPLERLSLRWRRRSTPLGGERFDPAGGLTEGSRSPNPPAWIFLAGTEAERRAGFPDARVPTEDLRQARLALRPGETIASETERARRTLAGQWGAVMKLADRLLRDGVVSGPDAEEILRASVSPQHRAQIGRRRVS